MNLAEPQTGIGRILANEPLDLACLPTNGFRQHLIGNPKALRTYLKRSRTQTEPIFHVAVCWGLRLTYALDSHIYARFETGPVFLYSLSDASLLLGRIVPRTDKLDRKVAQM